MRHLLAIPVGAAVCLVPGLLLAGGWSNLTFMMFLLVVCTAGIGLIPLVLVCWLVGLLTLRIMGYGPKKPAFAPSLDARTRSLAEYVDKARAHGQRDEEIVQCLFRAGWYPHEIRAAREACEQGIQR